MGKRYYCDYCDRSFQDNMHNRKKHLNGVQHHRAKKAWFDHFKGELCIADVVAIILQQFGKFSLFYLRSIPLSCSLLL